MMLAPNDARITGLRYLEPGSGSAAWVAAAGSPLEVLLAVEAGAALFGTGARFAAGVQIEGVDAGAIARVEGWLAGADWPSPVAELRVRVAEAATAGLADRLLGVSAFLRVNAAPPFLVSVLRGPDLFIAPAPL
ncbi:MAG TPA: hypothetical protein VHK00_01790 [Miltoncostaeaceae bacterium]|jgi:hypothetical protein|nr:hypothetical protein [Miltoncostaeaceae bacterium]